MLTKIMAVVCAMSMVASVPLGVCAGYEEEVAGVRKETEKKIKILENEIKSCENKLESLKQNLNQCEQTVKECNQKINELTQKVDKEKPMSEILNEIDSVEAELIRETEGLSICKEVLDGFELEKNEGKADPSLEEAKDSVKNEYENYTKRIDALGDRLQALNLLKEECGKNISDIEVLFEQKIKMEKEIKSINNEIKKCKDAHFYLDMDRVACEQKCTRILRQVNKNNSELLKWRDICAGSQVEDNLFNGQKIENSCGIFAVTNVVNYFNFKFGKKLPIRGFTNVIQNYLDNGGKQEHLNNVLSYEELSGYIKKNKINTYVFGYEESVDDKTNLEKVKKDQVLYFKEFLFFHFSGTNPSPVLNLSEGHWRLIVSYDDVNNQLLLVDSGAADGVRWVNFDSVANNSVSVIENKLNWQLIFFAQNRADDSDFFGSDFGRDLTRSERVMIGYKLRHFF